MENVIFFVIIFASFINFATGAMGVSSVNRTLLTMYKGVFESSIIYIDENGDMRDPFFDKEKLKENVTNYLDTNLSKYVTHYEASLYYINEDGETMCTSQYCSAVKVSLKCNINYFFSYEKARNIYIGAHYE